MVVLRLGQLGVCPGDFHRHLPHFYNEVTKTNVQVVRDKVLGEDVEVAVVEAFGMEFVNTELYSYAISFSLLLVALLSPLLSGIADYAGKKKFFLKVFCYLGSVACMALWWFDPQHLELSMLVLVLASMGYWSSLVFYNSYLPDIAQKRNTTSYRPVALPWGMWVR